MGKEISDNLSREEKLKIYLENKHKIIKFQYVNPNPSFQQMLRNDKYDMNKINKQNIEKEINKQHLIQKLQVENKIFQQQFNEKQDKLQKDEIKELQETKNNEQIQESEYKEQIKQAYEKEEIQKAEQKEDIKQLKEIQLVKQGSYCKYIDLEIEDDQDFNRHIIPVRRSVRLDQNNQLQLYSSDKKYIIYRKKDEKQCDEIYQFQNEKDEFFNQEILRQSTNIQETNVKTSEFNKLKRTISGQIKNQLSNFSISTKCKE